MNVSRKPGWRLEAMDETMLLDFNMDKSCIVIIGQGKQRICMAKKSCDWKHPVGAGYLGDVFWTIMKRGWAYRTQPYKI